MNKIELEKNLSEIWSKSRAMSMLSQDDMAEMLNVSKKTVQNWEAGDSFPNFKKAVEWFSVLGVPMYPYLMDALYADQMGKIKSDDPESVKNALHVLIDELDDFRSKELLFCLKGGHGSSPTGTIDLSALYLSLPLTARVSIASSALMSYELESASGRVKSNDTDLVRLETLKRYVDTAKRAVINGKSSYIFEEET